MLIMPITLLVFGLVKAACEAGRESTAAMIIRKSKPMPKSIIFKGRQGGLNDFIGKQRSLLPKKQKAPEGAFISCRQSDHEMVELLS